MNVARIAFAAASLGLACCDGGSGPRPHATTASQSVAPKPAPSDLPLFVDVAQEAGLVAANHTGMPDQKDWIVAGIGGGAIVLDYDQDGRMDLVVVDGTMLTEAGDLEYDDEWRTRVYHNEGGLRFADVTARSGVDLKAFGIGGASCDYDADGRPDFYVCCWGGDHLYRNRGDGTFEDVTDKAGVRGAASDVSTACCWGDVNGDGFPDLYVANYLDQQSFIDKCKREHLPPRQSRWKGVAIYKGPGGLAGQADRLYFGSRDGTFVDVTATSLPPEDPPSYGFQPIMTDVDGDGDLDIYVPNDTRPNFLLVNDGRGKFADQGMPTGVAVDVDSKPQASMGMDAADVDRDGWIDLVTTNLDFDHNTLYLNDTARVGRLFFRDVSALFNVAQPSYKRVSWGVKLLDYDCDGELDLFIACGHVYGETDQFTEKTGTSYRQRCLLERNVGPPSRAFEDVTDRGGPGLELRRVWRGAAFADFDDDGDLDVFVTALNDLPALLRNDGGNRNNFLVFRLVGKGALRDPCGARVTIRLADGLPRMEELHHGVSFAGDNDPRLFFGLGKETVAKRVEIRWPDGTTESFADVAARKFYVVEQGRNEIREDVRR